MAAHFLSPSTLRLLALYTFMGIAVLVLQNAVLEAPSPKEPAAATAGSQTPAANSAPAVAATSPRAEGALRQAGIPGARDGLWEHGAGSLEEHAGVRPTQRSVPKNDFLEANSAERAPNTQANTSRALSPQGPRALGTATAPSSYTLADAVKDAIWRKKTSEKLKYLFRRADLAESSGTAEDGTRGSLIASSNPEPTVPGSILVRSYELRRPSGLDNDTIYFQR